VQHADSSAATARIELAGSDWQFSTTVSVPRGSLQVGELLPFVHAVTDAVVDAAVKSETAAGRSVSCRKSCGACCRQLVPLAEVEARAIRDLVGALPEPRRSEVRRRFAQARRKLESAGYWEKLCRRELWGDDEVQAIGIGYFFQGIACPFLDDESCSIYADRPSACREYLVTSAAENCRHPSAEKVEQVALPFKMWTALARFDKSPAASRFLRWVPLIMALDEPDDSAAAARPGMELLRELFEHVAAGNSTVRANLEPQALDHPAAGGTETFASASLPDAVISPQDFPLRLGSDDAFSRVSALLRTAHYDENTLCRLLGVDALSDIGSIDRSKVTLADAIGLLIRIFLFVEAVARSEVERWLAPADIDALRTVDLLRIQSVPHGMNDSQERYYSSVWLYPVAGLWIASDRGTHPDGSDLAKMPDIVFPAIYEGTLRFLRMIPNSPASDALDLCSGSGVAALAMSRWTDRAVCCDITARASHFAHFNRRLNDCSNVEIVCGDLFGPVRDRSFDRIVAHPPFVPASQQGLIYRDAGVTGEALIQRIVEGLPKYLRHGGTFYAVCAAWDSSEGPFEERVRLWLGEAAAEFNIIFALHREISPQEVARQLPEVKRTGDDAEAKRWDELFRSAGLETNVYGAIVIQRVKERGREDDRRRPFTRRLKMGGRTVGANLEWALRWYAWRTLIEAQGRWVEAICRIKPRLSRYLKATVSHRVRGGGLVPVDVVLEVDRPFPTASRIDSWMLPMLMKFDGLVATEDVYSSARRDTVPPDGFEVSDFAILVANMIERGCLEIDDAQLMP